MNKKLISAIVAIIVVILASLVALANCGRSQSATQASSSSKVVSSTSKSSSSKSSSSTSSSASSQQASQAGQAAQEDNTTAAAGTEQSQAQQQTASDDTTEAPASDWASLAGTWTNDLGQSVTVSSNGQVTLTEIGGTYQLQANRQDNGVTYASIYNAEEGGSAAFIIIPAGQANPYTGEVSNTETIIVGQSADTAEHPYHR